MAGAGRQERHSGALGMGSIVAGTLATLMTGTVEGLLAPML